MNRIKIDQFAHEVIAIMPFMIREFARREDNELTQGKISCPQMVTLDYVTRHDRATMSEIAKVLSIQTSSASVLIDRLIRKKMLTRSRDQKDRRVVWIHATAKARQVMKRIMDQKRQSIKGIFGSLSDRERQQYLAILLKIKAELSHE